MRSPPFHLRLWVKKVRSVLSCSFIPLKVQCGGGDCVIGPREFPYLAIDVE